MSITSTDFDSFGALLRIFRKHRHFTQQQLAEAVGMHRHTICRWEQGDVLPASKAIVLELASRMHLNDQETRQLLDASLTAPAPLWGVPFPRNQFFTGREKTLQALHSLLSVEKAGVYAQWYALQGLGGVGKTQVALEYAYRHALAYRAVFWIEAESLERVLMSLQRIAEFLQLPEQAATESHQVIAAVQRWLATHDQWLLIWDNLEDLELPCHLLPQIRQGALLITTRHQAIGIHARGIALLPMEQEEAMLLLLHRAKVLGPETTTEQVQQLAARCPTEYMATVELVRLLGGLPLALDQAGAYLEETGCRLSDYLHCYTLQRASLLGRRGSLGSEHPQSVSTTFQLSLERVEREHQGAADLLRVCTFLHAEAIPEDLLRAGATHLGPTLASIENDPVRFDEMLASLRDLSLVQRQTEAHTLSLHRLVQVVLREQMDPVEERLWSERVVCMVNATFPQEDFATWVQCEHYLAQSLACVPLTVSRGKGLPEAGELLSKAGA